MSVINANKNNFNTISKSEKPVLLDFYASWCRPCQMVSRVLDEIAKERNDFLIAKINVEEEKDLAEQFGVMSIPTLVVLKDEKIINKSVGMKPKAKIIEMIQ
ncbi:MAG: thioredoxin [Clostridia bacterium]|nr:thioredoxin [Clostridia bacterium]